MSSVAVLPHLQCGSLEKGICNSRMIVETSHCGVSTVWFARHGHNLTGASPERGLIAASAQPKARVSIARWNLKEVSGESLA